MKTFPAIQVPVDAFEDPGALRTDMNVLFDYAEANEEYLALIDEREQKTYRFGLSYLNSPGFEALSLSSREVLDKAIANSEDDDLKRTLSTWNEFSKKREKSMLDNIYDYCWRNPLTRGAFLVGAEHVLAMGNGIKTRMESGDDIVTWKFWSRS